MEPSACFLTVLETLGPAEGAPFVLREIFDVPYVEIVIGDSRCRGIANRTRRHVAARRLQMNEDRADQPAGDGAVPGRDLDWRCAGPARRARP